MTTEPNTLPASYLVAEAAARENLDRPDHAALAQLLALPVEDCGKLVAATSAEDNLALRAALARAARIVNPNVYVPIASHAVTAIIAAIESACPIMRRFAASQYFVDAPFTATYPEFPATLAPDGDVIYVPYGANDPANVTIESVAAADMVSAKTPAAAPAPSPPPIDFPHDASATHPLDATPVGVSVVVTPAMVAALPVEDPLAALPVGTIIK